MINPLFRPQENQLQGDALVEQMQMRTRRQKIMAKINITRLPNATQEYDPGQFDQMIRLLEQIVFLLNTNFQQDLKEETESETFFLG